MAQRHTSQRSAIRQVFSEARRPLSPQEALERAQQLAPSTGIATVYRAIKELSEENFLQTVAVPNAQMRYELASKPHHHHFQCRICGKVFDFDGCPGDLKRLAPNGFKVEDHEIILFGVCSNCNLQEN